jgi:hypothetical protein
MVWSECLLRLNADCFADPLLWFAKASTGLQ